MTFPAAQLAPGAFAQVTGSFVAGSSTPAPAMVGELRAVTTPPVPATITIDGHPANDWGLAWVQIPSGPHTVCLEPLDGFVTPPCKQVTVAQGQTTTATFTVVSQRYLRVVTSPAQEATISVDGIVRNDWGLWMPWPSAADAVEVCVGPSRVSGSLPLLPCRTVNRPGPGHTNTVTATFP